jgi:hypothetical protein
MSAYAKSNQTNFGQSTRKSADNLSPTKTCVCGGAGCEQCRTDNFVRPHFFAGQLLTEEDLQLLGNYVTAKNRLHNRHLFGGGVVCGLDVTCHPCGGGSVIIHPGHALDCCGNDIVLSCPQTLDINAMVRELRTRLLGGFDCGNPCKDKIKDPCKDSGGTKPGAIHQEGNVEKGKETAREYCLYVRYCEELTDPVTPYTTDEPCGPQTCQPTRVREGVRYELRCREEDQTADDLFAHIRRCFGDLDSTERTAIEGQWHHVVGRQYQRAMTMIQNNATPRADPPQQLNQRTEYLAKVTDALNKASAPVTKEELVSPERGEARKTVREMVLDVLEAMLDTASQLARFYVSGKESRRTRFGETDTTIADTDSLKNAVGALNSANTALTKDLLNNTFAFALQKEYVFALKEVAEALVKLISRLIPSDERRSEFDLEEAAISSAAAVETPSTPLEFLILMMANQAPVTAPFVSKLVMSLDALRDWLLCRIDKATHLTDCKLREDVISAVLPTQVRDPVLRSDVSAYSAAARRLIDALTRYLRECFCAALNPPCPPCDDPAVLLACLKVKDCEIIGICNLDRTFVLSPIAVRYWIPPLGWFGELVEKFCCGPLFSPCVSDPNSTDSTPEPLILLRTDARSEQAIRSVVPQVCGVDVSRLSLIVLAVARLLSACGSRVSWLRQPMLLELMGRVISMKQEEVFGEGIPGDERAAATRSKADESVSRHTESTSSESTPSEQQGKKADAKDTKKPNK